jgi:hypothetical protein
MPEFAGVCNFAAKTMGSCRSHRHLGELHLRQPGSQAQPLQRNFLSDLFQRVRTAGSQQLHFHSRKEYTLNCNWKVYVDNYLDGGYHVPHLHKGLNSVLDYSALHHREWRALLPAIEPDGGFRRARAGLGYAHRAIAPGISGSIPTS